MSLPKRLTLSTGLDALSHATESFWAKPTNYLVKDVALRAIDIIMTYLPKVLAEPQNLEYRTAMSRGALLAGIAFNNSSVTIIHGMSRPIGALYHVPHGLSNAMLLDKCLRFAVSGCPEKFAELADAVGVSESGMDVDKAADAFINAASELCTKLKIQTPSEFGIDKDDFFDKTNKMADDAIQSGSPANTRRNPSKEDIINIYKSLF